MKHAQGTANDDVIAFLSAAKRAFAPHLPEGFELARESPDNALAQLTWRRLHIGVDLAWDRRDRYVTVTFLWLPEEAIPTRSPMVTLPLAFVVPEHFTLPEVWDATEADLGTLRVLGEATRDFGSRILDGDLGAFEAYANAMRGKGIPGMDWWASIDRDDQGRWVLL